MAGANKETVNEVAKAWDERGKSKLHYAHFQSLAAEQEIEYYKKYTGFKGKKILDVGCGLGGKTLRYALEGADIFAIDCSQDDINFARDFSSSRKVHINFLQSDAQNLAFNDNTFDVLILNDIVEHLKVPLNTLLECSRVLKQNGFIFVNFPPFYGLKGGHLSYYLQFPWMHLLPSRAVARILMDKKAKEGWITPAVVLDVFKSLNKMTIHKFIRLADKADLKILDSDITYCFAGSRMFRFVPFLNEFFADNARFVLGKIL